MRHIPSYQRAVTLGIASLLVACNSGGDSSSTTYQLTSQVSGSGEISPSNQSVQQGKNHTFTVTPDAGFQIQSVTGCNGKLNGNKYTTGAISDDCSISAAFITNVQAAIEREDHTLASAHELIQFSQGKITEIKAQRKALIDTLYQGVGTSISWDPGHQSVTLSSSMPENTHLVLRSNQAFKKPTEPSSHGLVYAGQQDDYRYAAMAANMFSVDTNPATDQFLKNTINWLIKNDDATHQLKLVSSHVQDGYWSPHNVKMREWLDKYYPNQYSMNQANSCDYETLSTCIDELKPDLIVLGDDDDERGYAPLKAAIDKARALKIPILVMNYGYEGSPMHAPLYQFMGLDWKINYWSQHIAKDLPVTSLKDENSTFQAVEELLARLDAGQFDVTALEQCDTNYIWCEDSAFMDAFKRAADWYRQMAVWLDSHNIDAFAANNHSLAKAGLLLADKYRSTIDYPIEHTEPAAWQQAMFADWVVSYARKNNLAQPDLGVHVLDRSQVLKGSNAHYSYPATVQETRTISVPYSDQWTTTGWYALPGQMVTVTRTDNSEVKLEIKLNYHRSNTNRAYKTKIYRGPLEVEQQRISVDAGETISFSTPYGGPIYAYLEGNAQPVQVSLSVKGVAKHPAIMDFSDPAEITRFNQAIESTELPHVDLRTDGAEQHLRRDRFLGAIGSEIPTVNALLKSIEEDHINSVYTLAGYKIQGKTLEESLPADVKTICGKLFTNKDCFDTSLHQRTIIQHANYDQNAHCGSGCSGNPWDASWVISPTGWGDNHELGHNLQTNRLNVQYVEAADVDDWTKYSSRAGENSNNIFPYYVKWKSHYVRDGNTTTITDGHMNNKDLFYVFMSDAAQVKNSADQRVVLKSKCRVMEDGATDRYTAPWKSNAYAVHNGYRMSFYIQMALRLDKKAMVTGDNLDNGFHAFTLLYQHSRIFHEYASNEAEWLENRDRLGFSGFPYSGHAVYGGENVRSIPGNDFMLVSLSVLTNQDWRPYFDMFGLRYSSLASAQVGLNAKGGVVDTGMYVLEDDLPPASMGTGLNFLPLSLNDGTTQWPRDNSTPVNCSL
ncbi:ImpA family metalloprotease [uncultured Photobacterium sp.]|uniref:ImpA family metalloprotease n=1 Tax=uncultured Photobacterium sp. TaxID=173973 RepID=UPI00260EB227|nr:ImpA family metalloprotease [uncultured Photobacterium sp.]